MPPYRGAYLFVYLDDSTDVSGFLKPKAPRQRESVGAPTLHVYEIKGSQLTAPFPPFVTLKRQNQQSEISGQQKINESMDSYYPLASTGSEY